MTRSTALVVRDLAICRGGRPIVEDASFAVRAGTLAVLLGPNGSGKSTLLQALAGTLRPASGEILLHGTPLASLDPAEQADRRAVLTQSNSVDFPFTVHELVRLGAEIAAHELPPSLRERIPYDALERVELRGFSARPVPTLSGGEQQRAHLARVLAQTWQPMRGPDPRLLLLDEPTSSLDPYHQEVALDLARSFCAAGGSTVVVLHDLDLAARHADQVLLMSDGRIVAQGPPEAVLTAERLELVYRLRFVTGPLVPGGRIRVAIAD